MAEKKINATTYKTEPMLATEALILQANLFKIIGPAIDRFGSVMKGFGTDKSEEEQGASNMAAIAAIGDIFQKNEPMAVAKIIEDIIAHSMILRPSGSYDKVDFDGDMTTRKADIMPLFIFVVKEQFGDFFTGLSALGNQK